MLARAETHTRALCKCTHPRARVRARARTHQRRAQSVGADETFALAPTRTKGPRLQGAAARAGSLAKMDHNVRSVGMTIEQMRQRLAELEAALELCPEIRSSIEAVLVETTPNPRHPFGAKGVGEVPIVPPLKITVGVRALVAVLPLMPLTPMFNWPPAMVRTLFVPP